MIPATVDLERDCNPEVQAIALMPQMESLDFHLPPTLEAGEPPEARGLRRDQVRLMVTYLHSGEIVHSHFDHLVDFLTAGDLLVINTSGTLNAAVNVTRADGTPLELHLSTHLPGDLWVIELRKPTQAGSEPFFQAQYDEILNLPQGGTAAILRPYRPVKQHQSPNASQQPRLWLAALDIPVALNEYLDKLPFRYGI